MDKFKLDGIFPADNAVFAGGFGLGLVAAGAQFLRSGSAIGLKIMRRNFLVTLEVTSKDRSYPWVLQWITAQGGKVGSKTQHLSVETSMKSHGGNLGLNNYNFVPGPGQHFMFYQGKLLLVQRTREQQMVELNSGKPWEKVEFTAIGRNISIFDNIIKDSYTLAAQYEEDKIMIYNNWGSEWRPMGAPRMKRPLDSVILADNVVHNILADVREWMDSSQWYIDRGIPYRRGYLLHGPPGSGKSSFIFALAGSLNYNICMLNLSERGMTDDRLALALSNVPANSIVLLEDIDAAFPNRDDAEGSSISSTRPVNTGSNVTFSGLLNVLDGVAASEERLVFMTTNHVSRLDPALIRPGRVDYVQLVGDASDSQIVNIFSRFYPETTPQMAHEFLLGVKATLPSASMALLQGYLLKHKSNAKLAVENVSLLVSGEYTYRPPVGPFSAGGGSGSTDAASSSSGGNVTNPSLAKRAASSSTSQKAAPVSSSFREITAEGVDRMVFNPQSGWEKDVQELPVKRW